MNVQNLLGHYLGEGLGHRFSFKPAPNCLVGLCGFVMFALESLNAFNVCVVTVFGIFILSFFLFIL